MTIERYVVVEDCGQLINPAVVEGQVRGGVAQGIGAVLLERSAYDDDAQFLAGTFMDYLLPTTTEIPRIEIHHLETVPLDPDVNFRGVGEGGMIVSPPTLRQNAIEDALAAVRRQRHRAAPAARADPLARRGGAGMKTPAFEYHAPRTIDEALALLDEHADEAKVLAGGQSLVPLLAMRLARPTQLVDVNEIDELAGIRPIDGTGLAIGAADPRTCCGALAARGRSYPRAGRGAAVHRTRRHPQPWDHRRLDRGRGRVRRSCPRSRSSRVRRWSCVPCRASASCRPTTSSSGTSRPRWPTTSC